MGFFSKSSNFNRLPISAKIRDRPSDNRVNLVGESSNCYTGGGGLMLLHHLFEIIRRKATKTFAEELRKIAYIFEPN